MVILLTKQKSKIENEIIEILSEFGGNFITANKIINIDNQFTVISKNKTCDIDIKKGVVIICDDTDKFDKQSLPIGLIGICEENNKNALKLFKQNTIPVICCGISPKNTVTISSFDDEVLQISLQRTITNFKGKDIGPAEFKIKLKKRYNPFSVMACISILIINGIIPKEF